MATYVPASRRQEGLGFPIATAIAAGASLLTTGASIWEGERSRDAREEKIRNKRKLTLAQRQLESDLSELKRELPKQMTKAQAQRILSGGGESVRQGALREWKRRFRGLPQADQRAELAADAIRDVHLDVAERKVGASAPQLRSMVPLVAVVGAVGFAASRFFQDEEEK